jgi:flagellar biosynthesis/type III secretory pathway protein FliH
MDFQFTYSGRILVADDDHDEDFGEDAKPFDPMTATPEEAHAQAQSIIAAAMQEAEDIKAEMLAGVDIEFERRLAERLTSAAREFNHGITECGAVLAEILNDALAEIIGEPRSPELLIKAVAKASTRHLESRSLTVIVSPEDHPRLEVLKLGIPAVKSIRMVADPSVSRGRCLLDAGGKRFDVSVDAQVKAFRQQARKLVSGMAAGGENA